MVRSTFYKYSDKQEFMTFFDEAATIRKFVNVYRI